MTKRKEVSNVDTAIYMLFDPDGKMRRCGETLDIATNYLVEGMGAGLWNALFGKPAKTRVKVFELHGWKVQQGTFTPNMELSGPEAGRRLENAIRARSTK